MRINPRTKFTSVFLLVLVLSGYARSDSFVDGSLEVMGASTLRQDVLLEGVTYFGKLQSTASGAGLRGFSVKVEQDVSTIEQEEVTPGRFENQTIYVDDYGWLSQSSSVWVEDYGYYSTDIWVDEWGYSYPTIWTDPVYDSEGNETTPGGWTTSLVPQMAITGGHMVSQTVWGVIGGHMETTGIDSWGVVGSHQEVQSIWVDEVRSSYTVTTYGTPHTKFVSETDDMVWSWYNNNRELLEVTTSGVSIPYPGDLNGNNRSMLTSTQFEQSFTTSPTEFGDYTSYGTKMTKGGLATWEDYGVDQTVTDSSSAYLKPNELIIEKKIPSSSGVTASSVGTRIAATDATFGGTVKVAGAILINPQGDISMGQYTSGPKP